MSNNIRSAMFFGGILLGIILFALGIKANFHIIGSTLLSLCGFAGTIMAILSQIQYNHIISKSQSESHLSKGGSL